MRPWQHRRPGIARLQQAEFAGRHCRRRPGLQPRRVGVVSRGRLFASTPSPPFRLAFAVSNRCVRRSPAPGASGPSQPRPGARAARPGPAPPPALGGTAPPRRAELLRSGVRRTTKFLRAERTRAAGQGSLEEASPCPGPRSAGGLRPVGTSVRGTVRVRPWPWALVVRSRARCDLSGVGATAAARVEPPFVLLDLPPPRSPALAARLGLWVLRPRRLPPPSRAG